MNKLIFLDIDGVLDTYKSRYMLDPTLMWKFLRKVTRSFSFESDPPCLSLKKVDS